MMQAKSLSVSKAVYYVRNLIEELDNMEQNDFDSLWDNVGRARGLINQLLHDDEECQQCNLVDEIELPVAPRQVARVVIQATQNEYEAAKAYWKECYHDVFHGIQEDLKLRLESPLLLTMNEIEIILAKLIHSPNLDLNIIQITKDYGVNSGQRNSPFGQELTKEALVQQMSVVRNEWNKLRNGKLPEVIDEVIEMVQESMQGSKPIQDWKLEAPIVMKLLGIAAAIAGTSSFAERTFSLARRLKTYLRSQMKNTRFHQLGILAWYPESDLKSIIDFVAIGNLYIQK